MIARSERLERLDHLESHAARIERVVVGDLRSVVRERDPAVGEVDARRHLRVALVRAVAEPEEAADLLASGRTR